MNLPRFAMQHKVVVLALTLLALVVGGVQLLTMPRRADPEFTISVCQVVTRWPGVETERVEQLVTHPLEEEINTLGEVKHIRSTSTTGLSVLEVELEDSVPPDVIPQIWDRVRAKVDIVSPSLPNGVMDPIVNDDFGDTSVMLLAIYEKARLQEDGVEVTAGAYSPRQLEIIADRLRERIASMAGVARAELHGAEQEAIYIETSRGNWSNLEATTSIVSRMLRERNIFISGGSIETEYNRFGIQPTGELDAVSQIQNMVVTRDDSGAPIYLRDVGVEVRRGYADPPLVRTRFGDTTGTAPCVIVSFTMKDRVKVTDLGREAERLIDDLVQREKVIPPDVAVDVVFDESVYVHGKISSVGQNMLQAIAIVVIVAWILSGFRSALVMASAIPLVMVISIGLSAMIGIQLEQMSIASLIIALGMLVDNAVVVSDTVRRVDPNETDRAEAVVRDIHKIMYPILAGTLTTVFAFLPLAFCLTGPKQEYIFSLPVVVSITLLVSWLLALTVTTLAAYWLVPSGGGRRRLIHKLAIGRRRQSAGEPFSIVGTYEKLVLACLRAKAAVIGTAVALFIGALLLPVGTQFFPDDARDLLFVDIWLPEGSSLAATDRVTRQVEQIMQELSQQDADGSGQRLARFYSSIGSSGPRFALGVDPKPPAANFAQIIVQTKDASLTEQFVHDLRKVAAERVAGARVIPRKLALGPPIDAPLAIRIYGRGFVTPGFGQEDQIRQQADRLKDVFRELDGVWDVHDTWGESGFQVDLVLDEDKANLAGVTNAGVAATMNAYFSGQYVTSFREGDHQVPIYFRLVPDERNEIQDPRSIFVEGDAGKVPLDSIADVQLKRKTTKIIRRDLNRMVEVRARVEPGVLANDKLAEAMPEIRRLQASLPPGMSLEIGGEQEETLDAAGEMMIALVVGVILIVLVLIVQYDDLVKPAIVLMTVPMGAIGAVFGLWITGNPLGFMPMLGLVSLAGIVVNSAILYLEFAETLIEKKLQSGEGLASAGEKSFNGLGRETFHHCLAEAGKIRLLPIFLTVSTTIGGLIPLALFGGPMWEGMAWLLIFGLAVATLLTLIVLPAIYAVFVSTGMTLVKPNRMNEHG